MNPQAKYRITCLGGKDYGHTSITRLRLVSQAFRHRAFGLSQEKLPCLGRAVASAVSFRVKAAQTDRSGQTPRSSSQRVGRRPLSGSTPTANATPRPLPFGLRTRFPRWLFRLRLTATRRHARPETCFAGLWRSLPRWQSASATPTRAGRRFLLDLIGGPRKW